jgi:hypothetical protein
LDLPVKLKGEVYCKNSEVSGSVDGKICVSQLLTLKTDSRITGDILTFKLSIEPGAKFTGNCKMSESENNEPASFGKENGKSRRKSRRKKPVSGRTAQFCRYSGMAFQMMAIILITTWGGLKLDKVLELETPVFTVVLSLWAFLPPSILPSGIS